MANRRCVLKKREEAKGGLEGGNDDKKFLAQIVMLATPCSMEYFPTFLLHHDLIELGQCLRNKLRNEDGRTTIGLLRFFSEIGFALGKYF